MTATHVTRPARQRGATLIELMVGVVIGMLAVLVIAQVALFYEGQKRTTTGGSDAQVSGALALQTLQRDVQMSGYGVTSGFSAVGGSRVPAAGCAIRARIGSTDSIEAPKLLVPVVIDNGADGAPDVIRVMSSAQANFAVPVALVAPKDALAVHLPANSAFTIRSGVNVGNAQGDLMLAVHVPETTPPVTVDCTLFNLNMNGMNPLLRDGAGNETEDTAHPLGTVTAGTPLFEATPPASAASGIRVGPRLGHVADATPSGFWNGDGATPLFPVTFNTPLDANIPNSYVVNLGRPADFIYRSYRINNASLMVRSFNAVDGSATDEELYPGIVTLQAVYGKALGTDPTQVTTWNAANPALDVTDSAGNTINGWARVVAVRIAIVARSQQFEKVVVTPAQPRWHPDGVTPTDLIINGTPNWGQYRYKVYETVVPLRNMIWQS
jgi:type IV pilus assembly protein PilW